MASGRCYVCFRPHEFCFCAAIPKIDNQTEVLILQHRREHFHRLNTARIVQQALRNSHLLADHIDNLAMRMRLQPRAGLLYPGPSARLISEVTADERPQQLVVLDGTWHHVKTMLRDIPVLQTLPRYCLAPTEPSRYRIRREPNLAALSTVEAAVAALRVLEPETDGLDQLLKAFDLMIDDHLAHPGSADALRLKQRRTRTFKNIPRALLGDLANIVVAYGESTPCERGCKRIPGPPLSWVAQRLGDGAAFSCLLTPQRPLDDVFLGHLELTRTDFSAALSLDEARLRWAEFRRPGDIVIVFRPGTARLFSYLAGARETCMILKSVDLKSIPRQPLMDGVLPSQIISHAVTQNNGRAGQRLAHAIALVRDLNLLANIRLSEHEPAGVLDR